MVGRYHSNRLGKDELEVLEHLLVAVRQPVVIANLAGEIGLEVLAPLLRHHDVADMKGRIDPAGDAAEDDRLDVEAVEQELRVDEALTMLSPERNRTTSFPASLPMWGSPRGLHLAGPAAAGYSLT